MKKLKTILIAAIAIVFAVSCSNQARYIILGTFEGGDGQTVYLREGTDFKQIIPIDSTVVTNGKFEFSGSFDAMKEVHVAINNDQEIFVLDPDTVRIVVTTKTHMGKDSVEKRYCKFEVSGSEEQEAFLKGRKAQMGMGLLKLTGLFGAMAVQRGEITSDSLAVLIQTSDSLQIAIAKNYLDSTRNFRVATFFIKDYVINNATFDEVKAAYDSLSQGVRDSKEGMALHEAIMQVQKVNVGGYPDDFTLPTPQGDSISLYSMRGNYLLLDFWASWCGPCRAELPNVKAIYNKWHDKGFDVLSVSLDDSKEKWLHAIQAEELPWKHGSSLVKWNCPVAKQFKVTGIPRMYILDPEGKIIAQDLRGEALAAKIDELMSAK